MPTGEFVDLFFGDIRDHWGQVYMYQTLPGGGNGRKPKFKKGDTVQHHKTLEKGKIDDLAGTDQKDMYNYWVTFGSCLMILEESELMFSSETIAKDKCDCGARKTQFPNSHAYWCSAFEDEK